MDYLQQIHSLQNDPKEIEFLYIAAKNKNEESVFQQAIEDCHQNEPENLLFAAWYHRLQSKKAREIKKESPINWTLAVSLSVVTGLVFWAISDFNDLYLGHIPHLVVFWSPIAAVFIMAFLALSGKRKPKRSLWAGLGLFIIVLYIFLFSPGQPKYHQRQYLDLMAIHLPLMAWVATGYSLLGLGSEAKNRFAFLRKTIEVFVTGGVFLIAGVLFGAITVGMFEALGITLPEMIQHLAFAGIGLIPVLAVASVYDVHAAPRKQEFRQGVGKIVGTMMRFLLPLTILVLVIYIFAIPFNFMEPFYNRDVLIVYNVMLFAIMGLVIGFTPVNDKGLSSKVQGYLRMGILIVSILAVIVSLYALSAVVWRMLDGGITMNRLTVIGWNTINIGILVVLVVEQFRHGREKWLATTQRVLSLGTNAYLVWGAFLILTIPWFFR